MARFDLSDVEWVIVFHCFELAAGGGQSGATTELFSIASFILFEHAATCRNCLDVHCQLDH